MATGNADKVMDALKKKFADAVIKLPPVIGNDAVNWSQDSFNRQGFLGSSLELWQARKKSNKKSQGRAILVQSGRLKRSIRIITITENSVSIGSDVPYAGIHNYGGTIVQAPRSETFSRKRLIRGVNKGRFKKGIVQGVQGFTFKERRIIMPQRRFIGNSPALLQQLQKTAQTFLLLKMKS